MVQKPKKVVLLGTVSSSMVGFRKDFIKALVVLENVTVYCFVNDHNEVAAKQIVELGAVPVNYFLSRSGLNPFKDFLSVWLLFLKLRKLQPDLVFSYFTKPVIFGGLASKLAGVSKVFGMLEGLGYYFTEQPYSLSLKTRVIRWIQIQLFRLSIPLLNKVIFLNHDDPKELLVKNSIKVKESVVLGAIGLNLADYPYVKPNVSRMRFVFIGRLLAEKGINEYLNAAKFVRGKYPNAEFVVLGDLDEENPGSLKKTDLDQMITEELLIYPGHVNNVAEWIAEASVFVLPSYREGFPRSTQEAMAIGRAIITTDVPGCRETVVNGVNGFLVPPWNAKELAEAMIKFIQEPELIEKMGLESYRIAREKFDSRKVNSKLLDILEL